MAHRLNIIRFRLEPSSAFAAYNPQGFGLRMKEAEFRFENWQIKPVAFPIPHTPPPPPVILGLGKGVIPHGAGYQRIIDLQTAWAIDDGSYVWQRRGFRDRFPYLVTISVASLGSVVSLAILLLWAFRDVKRTEDDGPPLDQLTFAEIIELFKTKILKKYKELKEKYFPEPPPLHPDGRLCTIRKEVPVPEDEGEPKE